MYPDKAIAASRSRHRREATEQATKPQDNAAGPSWSRRVAPRGQREGQQASGEDTTRRETSCEGEPPRKDKRLIRNLKNMCETMSKSELLEGPKPKDSPNMRLLLQEYCASLVQRAPQLSTHADSERGLGRRRRRPRGCVTGKRDIKVLWNSRNVRRSLSGSYLRVIFVTPR